MSNAPVTARRVGGGGKFPSDWEATNRARFLLAAHGVRDAAREPMTPEEIGRMVDAVRDAEAEMTSLGVLLLGGRLDDPSNARVARPANGRVRTTDGPFAESKEFLGGFYIIETADMEAAVGWASRVAATVNAPIEIRALVGEPGRSPRDRT